MSSKKKIPHTVRTLHRARTGWQNRACTRPRECLPDEYMTGAVAWISGSHVVVSLSTGRGVNRFLPAARRPRIVQGGSQIRLYTVAKPAPSISQSP